MTVGLLLLGLILLFSLRGAVHHGHAERVEVLSWYWHFVDAVWVVVFTTVYVIGTMSDGGTQSTPASPFGSPPCEHFCERGG